MTVADSDTLMCTLQGNDDRQGSKLLETSSLRTPREHRLRDFNGRLTKHGVGTGHAASPRRNESKGNVFLLF